MLEDLILPEMNPAVTPTVESALAGIRDTLRVVRTVDYAVVVDTGRQFSDGEPVIVRVWMPTKNPNMLVIGDGGATYSRLGHQALEAPDYAMSVRNELLEHLPVQQIKGQIVVMSRLDKASEALTMLADCCLMLDVAVIIANHMRPQTRVG